MNSTEILIQEDIDELLKPQDYIVEPTMCRKKKLSTKIHDYYQKNHSVSTECNIITAVMKDVEKLLAENKKNNST